MATNQSDFVDLDKIFLFGDSITQGAYDQSGGFGFAAALQHDYARKLDIVGRGFSGYNTSNALKILPSIIPPPSHSKIRLMIIFFGANDAVIEGRTVQHVPLEKYRTNLKKLLHHPVLQAHSPKLLLIIPPPICEYKTQEDDRAKERTEIQRMAHITKHYADTAREVAKSEGIPGVLHGSKEYARNEKLGELLRDGLHFTPVGYQLMFNELMKTIRDNYPELQPDSLPMIFPSWEVAPVMDDLSN
ncbi:SGNH hydrolase-type esterase domain-containing protein [Kalaharituber pfeilii]|nr:SGNH hydrolase-type esterase domain-containing protein [Kalaharituber pfeilii]